MRIYIYVDANGRDSMRGAKRTFRAEADDHRRGVGVEARVEAEVAAARGRSRPGERRPQAGQPGRA
jgi:hypothetical protein